MCSGCNISLHENFRPFGPFTPLENVKTIKIMLNGHLIFQGTWNEWKKQSSTCKMDENKNILDRLDKLEHHLEDKSMCATDHPVTLIQETPKPKRKYVKRKIMEKTDENSKPEDKILEAALEKETVKIEQILKPKRKYTKRKAKEKQGEAPIPKQKYTIRLDNLD